MSRRPQFTSRDFLGILAAVTLLSSYAEDDEETYGKDASYADRALTKMWALMPEAERVKVNGELGQ